MSQRRAILEHISTSELSKLLGITPARLGQLVAAGIIQKKGHGVYPATAVAAYCEFLRGGGAEDPEQDDNSSIDLRRERAQLVSIQRRIAEKELARLEERYVDVNAVAACLSAECLTVKHRIRGLPNEIAPKLVLMTNPAEIAAYIRREIDIVLSELSDGKEIVDNTLLETRDDK
jgi:hypothetical protein